MGVCAAIPPWQNESPGAAVLTLFGKILFSGFDAISGQGSAVSRARRDAPVC